MKGARTPLYSLRTDILAPSYRRSFRSLARRGNMYLHNRAAPNLNGCYEAAAVPISHAEHEFAAWSSEGTSMGVLSLHFAVLLSIRC